MSYKLTYSTMFDPPAEMHTRFEAALQQVRASLGARHPMFIDGSDTHAASHREQRSPIDRDVILGHFMQATAADAERAIAAAQAAFASWQALPACERVRLLRRVAQLIEERVYAIGAALALEVGKNRMEALGETQETADFFTTYCDD